MHKLRLILGSVVLLAATALPLLGSAVASAQHGADDPCPQGVENVAGCR